MTPQVAPDRLAAAALCILGAMAIIGLIDNFVPLIAAEAGLWQFLSMRSAMALVALGAGAILLGWPLRPSNWAGVMGRSLLIATAMAIYFGCLAILPIGQVVAGLFSAPIWVLAIAAFILRRRPGLGQVLAALVGFAGVLIVIGVGTAELRPVAVLPILAGFFYAAGQTATREWCAGETTVTLLFWFFCILGGMALLGLAVMTFALPGLVARAPEEAVFVLRPWAAPTPAFWLWTGVQAVGSLIGVALLVRGYQLAEASRVAVFEYSLLVFASLWALVLFGTAIPGHALVGMALILASSVAIALVQSPGATDRQAPPGPPARAPSR